MSRLQLQTASHRSVIAGNITVTLESQSLVVHLPFGWFVWNRPVAVVVTREGVVERLSIIDVTRRIQIVGLALTLLAAAVSLVRPFRRRKVHV